MEKQGKNQRKKNEKEFGSVVVGRRGKESRVDGGVDARKRKKRRRSESGDPGNGSETNVIKNSERRRRPKRRLIGGGEQNADDEIAKKPKKVRGQRSDVLQSTNNNAAEGVGIYAGFTMFEPKKKKKEKVVVYDFSKMEPSAPTAILRPAKFLEKMRARLSGGQFRMLNETLYTCRGEDAYELFKADPAAFTLEQDQYDSCKHMKITQICCAQPCPHCGKQIIVDSLETCHSGDARLAKSVKNKVFSLDLISTDPAVIACNMAHSHVYCIVSTSEPKLIPAVQTSLDASSVDVAVFCLSLMGTDYPSFIQEASRVLKPSGSLLIAEVRSRFNTENGGASPRQFIGALQSLGFSLISQDVSNKMFIMFYLQKQKGLKVLPKHSKQWPELKACVYKRR